MPTLLLSRTQQPESMRLCSLAASLGWQVEFVPAKGFTVDTSTDTVAIYAQPSIAVATATHFELALLEPPLDLLANIPVAFTSRNVHFSTLEKLRSLKNDIFAKPADFMEKSFAAMVYKDGCDIVADEGTTEDTLVLVSDPISWRAEYRVVVVGREIATWSPYIVDGWRVSPTPGRWPCPSHHVTPLIAFCELFLREFKCDLPPSFVMDVGLTRGDAWAIIEFNPIWCAGLYGCDSSCVLEPLSSVCCPRSKLAPADQEWVVERRKATVAPN